MTDLVDRLHADADAWDPHAPETAQLEREAAAEIERLTANLSHHIDAKAQLTLERDELRAEVERLTREAAEWQPIETAPRGPACLFLIVPKSEEETWTDSSERPITAHGEPYIVMGPYGQWGSLWKATHWMPLPRAPAGTPHCPTCGCGKGTPRTPAPQS